MNRYFEAHGLMNVESYTQISELSSSDACSGHLRPFLLDSCVSWCLLFYVGEWLFQSIRVMNNIESSPEAVSRTGSDDFYHANTDVLLHLYHSRTQLTSSPDVSLYPLDVFLSRCSVYYL